MRPAPEEVKDVEEKKVSEIVSKLTLDEKASLCSGAASFRTQAIPRLGIPAVEMSDGPHGLRKQAGEQDHLGRNESIPATCFPAACAVGSGWDPHLAEAMGRALGKACQANGVNVLLGPGVNIKRSPLCGRNFEYFSEDPMLSGTLGAAWVIGVQSQGVGASLKHFLANNQETRRRTQDSELDERTLREIYAAPFERVVREVSPWTVMAAYNKVRGTYMTENAPLLRGLLRDEWGYDGLVVSDWFAVHDRAAAVLGGCDLTMPGDKDNDRLIVEAVKSGRLDEKLLDGCCEHIVALAFKAQENAQPGMEYELEAGHALAREIASECMVLLKNDGGILPLNPGAKIAILGAFATEPRYQGAGSSRVNAYQVPAMPDVTAGMDNVTYARGFNMGGSVDPEIQREAVEAARSSDVAVIFAGLPPVLESEGYDRWVMKLPVCQLELIKAVCAVQPNTVVVLENGSSVEMDWADGPKAVLEAYLGGEAVCEAIWDVLTGKVNPSGHLAETFPQKLSDNPSYLSWPGEGDRVEYREGVFVGYRYYETAERPTAFPFGYGLSYTDFEYSDLTLDRDTFAAGDKLTVTVKVKNTGKYAGKALVQCYVGADRAATGFIRPIHELRAFKKLSLNPGEERTVSFTLDKRAFSCWDTPVNGWRVPGGEYEIQIGTSVSDIVLRTPIHVEDEYIKRDVHYTVMTPISDIVKHPSGRAMYERVLPAFTAAVSHMARGNEDMPYAGLRPADTGLMAEPLQTLQRLVPSMSQKDWDDFLNELNG